MSERYFASREHIADLLGLAVDGVVKAVEDAINTEMDITQEARWYIEALDAGDGDKADRWLRHMRRSLKMIGEDDE